MFFSGFLLFLFSSYSLIRILLYIYTSPYSFLMNYHFFLGKPLTEWMDCSLSFFMFAEKTNFSDKYNYNLRGKEANLGIYWNNYTFLVGKKIIYKGAGYLKNPINTKSNYKAADTSFTILKGLYFRSNF